MADGIVTEPLVTGVDPDTKRMPFPVGDAWGQLVQAIRPLPVKDITVDWFTNEVLTVSTTVVQLTQRLAGFDYARIQVATDSVRFTLNDDPPTSTVGWLLDVDDTLILNSVEEIKDVKFIRSGSSDVTLTVFYGKKVY